MSESSVDNHPQRLQIIQAIRAGKSLRAIAAMTKPPVSAGAVQRLRRTLQRHESVASDLATIQQVGATKPWVEHTYVRIVNTAMEGSKPDLPAARAALDSIARLNGYDAPRRSESVNLNLHALPPAALAGHLQAMLQSLPENERKALISAEPAIDAEIISDSSE